MYLGKKLLFLQVSSIVLHNYEHKRASNYYEDLYRLKDGYEKNNHFWELPLWVVEIDGFLDGIMHTTFRVIDSNKPFLDNVDGYDYILFSATNANQTYIKQFVAQYEGRAEILYGGYIKIDGIKYLASPKDLAEYLGVPYKYALNYRHFMATKTIPRITLSNGCQSRCKFCVVGYGLEELNRKDILHQADQMSKCLQFKYAYVSDKTFGQAFNHTLLWEAYHAIKKNNPKFEGFIIQTTAAQLNKPWFIDSLPGLRVKIVEIGMESFNDKILKSLRKPASEYLIRTAVDKLHKKGLKIILNVVTGLVGETLETYQRTLDFVEESKEKLFALNIYTLNVHSGKEYGKEVTQASIEEQDPTRYFYNRIFELATEIL
jgi:hypothetical protein